MIRPKIFEDTGEWSAKRRPKINVGNGDGFIEVAELSIEHEGGDWTDLGYFFSDEVAIAVSHLPFVIQRLEVIAAGGDSKTMCRMAKEALTKLGFKKP
jgi:hypothetical protein